MIDQWFPNVNDLTILFQPSYSPESFPSVLDLGQVTTLSLHLEVLTSFASSNLRCIIDLLKRTNNIQSLAVHTESFIQRDPSSVKEIYSIIIRHVDWSKLRHLEIPICNLNHVQMMLSNRFRNLYSVRFCFNTDLLTSEEITAFVKTSISDCSIWADFTSVFIWIGERMEKTKGSKRSTSYFRSFLQSLKSLVQ